MPVPSCAAVVDLHIVVLIARPDEHPHALVVLRCHATERVHDPGMRGERPGLGRHEPELESVLLSVARLECVACGDLLHGEKARGAARRHLLGVEEMLVVRDAVRHQPRESQVEEPARGLGAAPSIPDRKCRGGPVRRVDGERIRRVGDPVVVVVRIVQVRREIAVGVRRNIGARTRVRGIVEFVRVVEAVGVLVEVGVVRAGAVRITAAGEIVGLEHVDRAVRVRNPDRARERVVGGRGDHVDRVGR